VHAVAGGSPELVGLGEVEGEPLAVVALSSLLGLEGGRGAECDVLVVVRKDVAGERIGMAVDRAVDLVRLPRSSIGSVAGGLVRGEAQVDGRMVRVLDLAHLAATDE